MENGTRRLAHVVLYLFNFAENSEWQEQGGWRTLFYTFLTLLKRVNGRKWNIDNRI